MQAYILLLFVSAPDETLKPDDAIDVLDELVEAQNHSYELGLKLKLQPHEVASIHSTYSKPRSRLLHVLIEFTEKVEPKPTWRVIIDALRSPSVDLPRLAKKVEEAYFPTTTSLVVPEPTGKLVRRSTCLICCPLFSSLHP